MYDENKKKGRPLSQSIQDNAMDKYTCRITAWHARILRKEGGGNFSKGVRLAAELLARHKDKKE